MPNHKVFAKLAVIASVAMLTYGCQSERDEDKVDEKKPDNQVSEANFEIQYDQTKRMIPPGKKESGSEIVEGKVAYCIVNPKEGSNVVGAVTFTEVNGGVRVIADVGGLSPGKHGFHIHEHGDCSAADASTAGGHFNPTNKKHGGPDSAERHVGDLGNLEANEFGFAHYDRVDSVIAIDGDQSIIGKSVVIHAAEDDLATDPTGNSGKRIGCGEIIESDLEL